MKASYQNHREIVLLAVCSEGVALDRENKGTSQFMSEKNYLTIITETLAGFEHENRLRRAQVAKNQ